MKGARNQHESTPRAAEFIRRQINRAVIVVFRLWDLLGLGNAAMTGLDLPPTMTLNPFPNWRAGRPGLTATQIDQWVKSTSGSTGTSVPR